MGENPFEKRTETSTRLEALNERGFVIVVTRAFGPNGEDLVEREGPRFSGEPGVKLLVRQGDIEEEVVLSPYYGDPSKIASESFKDGVKCELFVPGTTTPLDKQTLINSAKKTSRAVVIDEGYNHFGTTAEIAATIANGAFYYLDAPVERIGGLDTPIPMSPALEDLVYPSAGKIVAMAKRLCNKV